MTQYDGNQPGSWFDCVWQPKAIRNVITLRKIEMLNELANALMQQNARISDFETYEGKPITDEQRRQLQERGY